LGRLKKDLRPRIPETSQYLNDPTASNEIKTNKEKTINFELYAQPSQAVSNCSKGSSANSKQEGFLTEGFAFK
jgi:hypothetical protein